jgi:hypothetical protein
MTTWEGVDWDEEKEVEIVSIAFVRSVQSPQVLEAFASRI